MEQIRILHVDDGPDFLALTKVHLEEKDAAFSVDTATTAQEGLKLLGESNYDAVLSDYQMPGMDGLEFLQYLRESGSEIPFIMLTGRGREEVAIAALNKGANHYIQKGKDIESLFGTVAHVIRETVEKRRADDKLAAIEKERQIILDSAPAMIFHVDKDGNYVYVNKLLADACGLECADLVGKSTREIFPELGEDYVKSDEEVLKSGKPKKEVVGVFQTPEGKKWVKSYKMPIKAADGTVTGIIGLAVDITERKRVEEKLRNTQTQLLDTIEFLPDATFAIDCDKRVIAWNRATEEMTGVRKEEIVGEGDYAYAVPFYGVKRPVLVDLIFSRDKEIESQYDYVTRKGDTLFAEVFIPTMYGGEGAYLWVKASPLFDNEGTIVGAIESVRDITERKQMEKELKASEERSKLLLNRLPAILYTTDTELRITLVRGSGTANADLPPDQALGLTLKEVLTLGKSDVSVSIDSHQQALRGEFVNYEGVFNDRIFHVHVEPLRDAKGTIVGTLGLGFDITERKQAEDALRESQHRLRDIINFFPDATLAIDLDGKVIAWNYAIEKMTGIKSEDMLGKGNYEYAIPFYGIRRPILVDLVLNPDETMGSKYATLSRAGNCRIAETATYLRGQEVYLWGKACTIYDARGNVIGAIESIRDISERKRTEKALQENEERMKTILETSQVGIVIIDAETHAIVDVNPRALETMGANSKEQVIGQICHQFICPAEEGKCPITDLGEPVDRSECVLLKINGDEIPIIKSVVAIMLGGRKCVIESFMDITERKQAEEALRESEKQYRRLVGLSFEGIAVHSEGELLIINPAGAELLGGTSPDQFIGKPVMDFVHPDYHGIVQERVRQQTEDEREVPPLEEKFIRLDGTVIDVEVMGIPITHQNKPAVQVVFRDITERKRTEEMLQESEKRFRDLTELLPQTVYELDTEGNLVYANKIGLKLFGYSRGDLKRGLTAFQMFIPEDYDRVVKSVQKVLSGQKLVVNEYTALRKDGTTFPVIIYGTPRMHDDKIVGVRGVVVDITERKRAEIERERFLRELEVKNAEMERFTYSISHDLKSPLFSIRGFTSLAREDLEQGKLQDSENDLKRVESAAEKMDSLLNDTLQLSRIGRVANPPEDVPFGTIVAGALEQVATQIKSSGTDVSIAKDFPTVHVDRERIEEILVNLIVNSIKYMGEQSSPKIEIGYRVEEEDTVFFVKDNGIGIDPSLHKRVFELFYQVDKRIKGTGAGLAIVKRIIEVHGGRIWIESEKGKGCTVCFTLPIA
jgi:PAS domain S-box-containing protein